MTIRNHTRRVLGKWLSMGDVARLLGISRVTAIEWARTGKIPGAELVCKDGRGERWRVEKAACPRISEGRLYKHG